MKCHYHVAAAAAAMQFGGVFVNPEVAPGGKLLDCVGIVRTPC
jgi:hypothetical protein